MGTISKRVRDALLNGLDHVALNPYGSDDDLSAIPDARAWLAGLHEVDDCLGCEWEKHNANWRNLTPHTCAREASS